MKAKSAGQVKTPFQKVKYFGGLSLVQRSDYLQDDPVSDINES